jgi:hypothetical protein
MEIRSADIYQPYSINEEMIFLGGYYYVLHSNVVISATEWIEKIF